MQVGRRRLQSPVGLAFGRGPATHQLVHVRRDRGSSRRGIRLLASMRHGSTGAVGSSSPAPGSDATQALSASAATAT